MIGRRARVHAKQKSRKASTEPHGVRARTNKVRTRMWPRTLVLTCLALLSARSSWAEAKFVLLIGKWDYKESVDRLEYPLNDIRVVGDAFRSIGFTVTPVENAGFKDVRRAVDESVVFTNASNRKLTRVHARVDHGVIMSCSCMTSCGANISARGSGLNSMRVSRPTRVASTLDMGERSPAQSRRFEWAISDGLPGTILHQ